MLDEWPKKVNVLKEIKVDGSSHHIPVTSTVSPAKQSL